MHQPLKDTLPAKGTSSNEVLDDHVHAHDASVVLGENMQVIDFNEAFSKIHIAFTGQIVFIGMSFDRNTLSAYPQAFLSNLFTVSSGERENSIFQFQDVNNPLVQYKTSIARISRKGTGGEGICIFLHPMETTPSLAINPPNQELFKLLVESSTDVFQLADSGLIVTYTSQAVEAMLGYLPHQLLGKNVLELVHPDDRENVRDWLISLRSIKEKMLSLEYRLKNKNGEWVWIENNGRNMIHHPSVKSFVLNFRNIQAKKIADHALVQTEQRLSLLLNNTEESFIILNSRLRIITYNRAAQVHSPYFFNQELQSGMSVLDLVAKEEVADYIVSFEKVFAGEEVERETTYTDADGKVHIFSHNYRPLFDLQRDIFGVFITSTDITERKKLSEELAANSERLETAQQIAKLAYYELDFVTRKYFCSDQFFKILNIDPDNFNGLDLRYLNQVIHPEDRERVQAEFDTCFKSGTDFNMEFRIGTNGSSKVLLAIGGVEKVGDLPLQFRLTIQDITDSKMAILAIQTLESKFRSLFESSIDGVILSKKEGAIISANPAVCRMLGYLPEEITKLHRWDLLESESPLVQEMMDQRKKTGSYMGELMIRHKDGHFVPAEVTSMSMTDGQGTDYLSTIIRDITEKKKIEKEQKALTEELLKNNQDLQQFSFITSHNLRAPVANLLSLLSLYNKKEPADDFNQVLIEKFEEATNQLNQTLNDLVNVLVIKSNNNIEREAIHFSNIYAEVRKNVESLLNQQQGVIETDFSEVDEISYNRIHIESIFLNMISNAIRYCSPERKPLIKIRSYRTAGWVVVDFQDNGLGMDLKRYGDRLFGLYQRFHENKEGKGLGLYMTRSQVMAMGGKIEVESQPGMGTTFKIYFKS